MLTSTPISAKQKSLNSFRKKVIKKDIPEIKIKEFVVAFYAHYSKMMTKLSHE